MKSSGGGIGSDTLDMIGATPDQEIKKCAGAYNLLRKREMAPSDHMQFITPRNICVYVLL